MPWNGVRKGYLGSGTPKLILRGHLEVPAGLEMAILIPHPTSRYPWRFGSMRRRSRKAESMPRAMKAAPMMVE